MQKEKGLHAYLMTKIGKKKGLQHAPDSQKNCFLNTPLFIKGGSRVSSRVGATVVEFKVECELQ